MRTTLVGYTGFVGGNLAATHRFDGVYNSKNITQSFGAENGLVVYSGMPAEKFLANADAAADLAVAQNALENIRAMRPQKLVLISTVDVYPCPVGVYEDTSAGTVNAPAYGANRLQLEGWVRAEYPDSLILRLPGLYGRGLKKNFLFDMLTITPGLLKKDKYDELSQKNSLVAECYQPDTADFYRLDKALDAEKRTALKAFFQANDFNALCFTDSRSVFQFYDLSRLWGDIQACLAAGLTLVNLGTQPVQAAEVYRHIFGQEFVNELPRPPMDYDMRTRHAAVLGGTGDYVQSKTEVLAGIKALAERFNGGSANVI